jgi:hypothetical protein
LCDFVAKEFVIAIKAMKKTVEKQASTFIDATASEGKGSPSNVTSSGEPEEEEEDVNPGPSVLSSPQASSTLSALVVAAPPSQATPLGKRLQGSPETMVVGREKKRKVAGTPTLSSPLLR